MIRIIRSSFLPLIQSKSHTAGFMNTNNSPFNIKRIRFYSSNFDVNTWVDTLDEAQQKRVRFVQNEVNLQFAQANLYFE